eukprot:PLAT3871.3.p1 GENE.PLAT3871.3~~PLAT3871.3.p1  ORF type:complete len:258 (+),score=123.25 PLAT3871.3:320-1093(+)
MSAPALNYAIISALSVATIGLSNTAIEFLNFPTQVLFKSSKLIPVMVVGMLWLKKTYTRLDFVAVLLITGGLVLFSLGDAAVHPNFNPWGIFLISGALVADAFIGNYQEKTMKTYGVQSGEMVVLSKVIGFFYLLVVSAALGQLQAGVRALLKQPETLPMMLLYSMLGFVGENFVMLLVQRFGALVAVTTTSCRKAVSIIISFLVFPKPYTHAYALATLCVFGGIAINVYVKNKDVLDRRCCPPKKTERVRRATEMV